MSGTVPVAMSWKRSGLLLEATTASGRFDLASALDDPGQGPAPMQVLAVALGGCTAMDVLSILKKMRQPVEEFRVEVSGERADEHPKRYTSLDVVYRVKGDVDEAKLARAIELSETRYCSVAATLRPGVALTSRYVIER